MGFSKIDLKYIIEMIEVIHKLIKESWIRL